MLDLHAYLNRLASAEPTPGGGSAATLVGALGAALIAMVARLTLGSRKHAAQHADATLLVASADALRAQFVAARPHDEAAFKAVVAAQGLPRATDADKVARSAELQAALVAAAQAPLEVAALATKLLEACEQAALLRNTQLMSDVQCAIAFGQAALDASVANVRINHRYITNEQTIVAQSAQLAVILHAAETARAHAQASATSD